MSRTIQVNVRLNEDEYAQIERAARLERRGVYTWARIAMLEKAAEGPKTLVPLGELAGEEQDDATEQDSTSSSGVSSGAPARSPSGWKHPPFGDGCPARLSHTTGRRCRTCLGDH